MSLGQRIIETILGFVLYNSFWLIVGAFVMLMALDYYNKCLRINRKTDNIDLMNRYLEIKMRMRYETRIRTNRID